MDRFPFFLPSIHKLDNQGKENDKNSFQNEMATHLVDIDTKNYLYTILQQCHEKRLLLYSQLWNGLAWIMILIVVGGMLYLCWKYRPTEEQKRQRKIKTQKLVLSKMREMQEMNRYTQPNGITFLPTLQNKGY